MENSINKIVNLVPEENIQIFCYLHIIENGLREFIIESLENLEGTRWYKRRIPGDVLEKYLKGIAYEKNIKWAQLVSHHPIYYIDFPDLKKIIECEDNWKQAFEKIFKRKDILSSTLSELEFLRNKIAHNRKASSKDVEIVKADYVKLSEAIGESKLNEFAAKCTHAIDISIRLAELQKEAEKLYYICKNCDLLEKFEIWNTVCDKWWLDASYLGHKIDGIINYFETLEKYANLPRARGSGYKIEVWVRTADIEERYNKARIEFSEILNSMEVKK